MSYSDVCLLYQPDCNRPKQGYPRFSAAAQCQPLQGCFQQLTNKTHHTSAVTHSNNRTFLQTIPIRQQYRECVKRWREAEVFLQPHECCNSVGRQFLCCKRRSLQCCSISALCTWGALCQIKTERITLSCTLTYCGPVSTVSLGPLLSIIHHIFYYGLVCTVPLARITTSLDLWHLFRGKAKLQRSHLINWNYMNSGLWTSLRHWFSLTLPLHMTCHKHDGFMLCSNVAFLLSMFTHFVLSLEPVASRLETTWKPIFSQMNRSAFLPREWCFYWFSSSNLWAISVMHLQY